MMTKHVSITHAANAEDEATGKAFIRLRFPKVGGRVGDLVIPRQEARNPVAIYEHLLEHNADVAFNDPTVQKAIEAAIATPPQELRRHAARLGWTENKRLFVMSHRVIGSQGSKFTVDPPLWINDRHHGRFGESGTLESWQGEVARRALSSSVSILSICDAFAAALLCHAEFSSFGHNIFGYSKAGKTTCLQVAASILGIGREADLLNWGASASARIESGPLFNDQLMPLNEVGLISGSKKAAYSTIRETIYRLGEGRGTLKNTASPYATARVRSEFRVVFLSTAEHSFDEYAQYAGEDRDEGEYARCLDIPINEPGRKTIVDFFPASIERDRRPRWAAGQVIKMRQACTKNYGTAIGPYIEHLIKNRTELRSSIEGKMTAFQKDERYPKVQGALSHAARNIALAYAAGVIAVEAGVLQWPEERLREGLLRCLARAITAAGGKETVLSKGKRVLKAFLKSARVVEQGDIPSRANAKGYSISVDGQREYVIHAASFRKMFYDQRQHDEVVHWLRQTECLRLKATRFVKGALDSHITSPRWPGGKVVRSIVFSDPFHRE